MTRDEHRQKCIETGAEAMRSYSKQCSMFSYEEAFTAAFDALHGIAVVLQPLGGAVEYGDLTNPPEDKP